MKNKLKQYVWNILIGLTQFLNTILGGNPDQPFSGRTGIAYLRGKRWGKIVKPIIDKLFNIIRGDKNHCIDSIEWDRVSDDIKKEIGREQ